MADQVREALRKAFNLGQTYWLQSDSESYRQNALADETFKKYEELVEATVAATASHAAEVEVLRSALEKAERRLFGAWQMLEAINEGDPSRDRKAAASRALDGLNEVRAALKGDKP